MLGAIRYALANLVNFNGRDARQTFWYWVLAVYVVTIALSMAVTVPVMLQGVFEGIHTAAQMHDDQAAAMIINRSMAGSMQPVLWLSVATNVGMVLLIAASLVRRLHDSGMSGWWALAPGVLQAVTIAQAPGQVNRIMRVMTEGDPGAMNPAMFMHGQLAYAGLGWVALGLVIWFGVRKSDPDPNRYGDEPVRF